MKITQKKLILFLLLMGAITSYSQTNPLQYVDTKIGVVDSRGSNCVIGPQLPYGSINPSPQSQEGRQAGYNPEYPIDGFAQLHVSGTGWGSYGHFLISPQVGLNTRPGYHSSKQSEELGKPYYYSVKLDRYGLQTEITPSHYSAIYRFTYPESSNSSILFDASQAIFGDVFTGDWEYSASGKVVSNEVRIDSLTQMIYAKITFEGGWIEGSYSVYCVAKINKAFNEFGTWKGGDIFRSVSSMQHDGISGQHIGSYCKFKTGDKEPVYMKIACSIQSYANAENLLKQEIPGWDFEAVKQQAIQKWNEKLESVKITTESVEQKTIFYSALYRTFTLAKDRTLDKPSWALPTADYWDDNYAFWDTWRTAYPLLTLIDQKAVSSNISGILDRYRHFGKVKDSFVAGRDKNDDQGGSDVDNILVDAYLKNVKGVDWDKVYGLLKNNADHERNGLPERSFRDNKQLYANNLKYKKQGWIPHTVMSSSNTLEYNYNDYCLSLMAKAMNKTKDEKKYLSRSQGWKVLWNDTLSCSGYKGFIDAKEADGTFSGIKPNFYGGSWIGVFYEADAWTYSFNIPHAIHEVIHLSGGADQYVQKLNFAFQNNLVNIRNEPAFLITRTFSDAGRPDLTSYWTHYIMTKYDRSGYPENEDTGAMGSWYVFSALGIFPNAGQDSYYLNAPLYSRSEISLSNGKKLTIIANGASEKNIYIKSCTINGKKWNSPVFHHCDISNGGIIEMELVNEKTNWGCKSTD